MSAAVLDCPPAYEEERGKPVPSQNHSCVQANLIMALGTACNFRVASELTLEIEGQNYTPDLCVYPRDLVNRRRDVIRRTDPPLLVVEILSPSLGNQERQEKVAVYLAHGVKNCWVVSPFARTVTVYLPDGEPVTRAQGTVTDPATGLSARLEEVFS